MLEAGIQGKNEKIVTAEDTAIALKSGTLEVLATPALVALIEEAAWRSVADELEEGWVTVGTSLNVKHISATPVGMKITCKTTLTEVDGRRLVFAIEVEDETGRVGEGIHERFIVASEKFQKKADAKLNA